MKLFDFVLARNGIVELKTIDQPTREYDSLGEVFETALNQEERVTEQINSLYELAFHSKAFAELIELQWFLTEQVEEEKTAREWVARFRLVGDDPGSLLDLDRELGTRAVAMTAVAPAGGGKQA
jgi:ferritin